MNRTLLLCLPVLLSACVSLPGEDADPATRYMLQGPGQQCSAAGKPLALSIIKVSSGLDTDRVARRNASSGEMTYLQGVRWVERVGGMMEQRLAMDLECAGYAVITSHHSHLDNDKLVCEVRALNLVQAGGADTADVSLSCVQFRAHGKTQNTILVSRSSPLRSWSANNAMTAMSRSYATVFKDLSSRLQ